MNRESPSPWQLRPSAGRLLAWRSRQLAVLAAALDVPVLAWAGDWGLEVGTSTGCDNAAPCGDGTAWHLLGRHATGAAWIQAGLGSDLCLALMGASEARTPVAGEVLAACWRDLRVRLSACLQLAGAPDAVAVAPTFSSWSGAVQASLAFGVRAVLDAGCVASLLKAPEAAGGEVGSNAAHGPLHALGDAIAGLRVPLTIRLRACEIDMGSLQDLNLGDVVRLPHALDAAVAVEDQGGRQLFCGQLARSVGQKAVELGRIPA